MAHLNPQESFDHLKSSVLEGVAKNFPVVGREQTLHLEKLEVDDKLSPQDIRAQQQAKVSGGSFVVPVYAHLVMKDNATGKILDQRKIRMMDLPKTTIRHSYIIDGNEVQVDSQWQLKPGVYTRRRENGVLETEVNAARPFDLHFDPVTKEFHMGVGTSNVPAYPILRSLGVQEEELQKSWGKEILEANKTARGVSGALEKFYTAANNKKKAPSKEAAEAFLHEHMQKAVVRPDAVALTLGKPFTSVNGEMVKMITEKMLRVQGGAPEDDRDNLVFKDLRTVGDYATDVLRQHGRMIRDKMSRKINSAKDIRDVVKFDVFNEPLKRVFDKNAAARSASQINPVEMISSARQTTIMGVGGVKTEHQITDEAKDVNPSHLGFLDPIHTPEGSKTGVTLRLPVTVRLVGKEAKIPLYNLKTNKTEYVGAMELQNAAVVLPDQVKWQDGKPVALHPVVKTTIQGTNVEPRKLADAQYVMRHPSQIFSLTSNLIPFLNNDSGGRAGMAARHIEQSISLMNREAPLVQVATGSEKAGLRTYEELLGQQSAHLSPVEGHVESVKKDAIIIRGKDGTKHEVQTYHNYPLNDAKGHLNSSPLVAVGDKVKEGQVVADTNFSKNGVLALGTNLRVAFLPFKGYNFEDGVVISKSASEKLISEHMHKPSISTDSVIFNKEAFKTHHSGVFTPDQLKNLDEKGIVHVGTVVKPGDPLIAALRPFLLKDRTEAASIRKSIIGQHNNVSLLWDSDFSGEVVGVHKSGKHLAVHVKTLEPMQAGDKIAGRHGNKGIVSVVLPDAEMPHTKDGKPIEVALNPLGVPGRINPGQIFETAAGKIAKKTGKTYVVENFNPNIPDQVEKIKKELHQHGLSDTEELIDPVTKKSLGPVMVGHQYMQKLVHQVDKKLSVRSGMQGSGGYDVNLVPTGGSGTGGQSLGALGLYSLLAHGAKANIREMQTLKSEGDDPQSNEAKQWKSLHRQVWMAIQKGDLIPPPKPTFAFQKFQDMIRGAGINIEKHGHSFQLSPLTDKHIVDLASEGVGSGRKLRVLPKPAEMVKAKLDKNNEPSTIPGGMFDPHLTGGHGGRKWSVIELAEPLPNPVFETPITKLLGITEKEFHEIIRGDKAVTPSGKIVTDANMGVVGGRAIKQMLDKIDVKKELEAREKELTTASRSKMDDVLKRVKYLRALDNLKMKPSEAYILHYLPIIPPSVRPVNMMDNGRLNYADVNNLYKEFAMMNSKLHPDNDWAKKTPEGSPTKKNARAFLYEGFKAITGMVNREKDKGILQQIAGSSPKTGYFQDVLMNRRQDLSMRTTIIPEPSLGLDEVGLPKHAALELFKPFVVKKFQFLGGAQSTLEAQKHISDVQSGKKNNDLVWKALHQVMDERPVLLKRDPVLHRYGIQAFKARPTEGSAIKIHPLVCGGFNADFDGDTMSAFVPITHEAVREASKMTPSNNLFSEATGAITYYPTLDSAVGLYKMSLTGKETAHKYNNPLDVLAAFHKNQIGMTDVVQLGAEKTTAGRVLMAAAVPAPMHKKILHDFSFKVDKGGLRNMLTTLGKEHPGEFSKSVDKLKNLGNETSFGAVSLPHDMGAKGIDPSNKVVFSTGAHTLSLDDFKTDKAVRDKVLGPANKEVAAVRANSKLTKAEKDHKITSIYLDADEKMKELHSEELKKNPTNLFTMYRAGSKPSWLQYKQMALAPMLVSDSHGKPMPNPITRSYSEGVDVAGYWTQSHGARRGAVLKVQEVSGPGYLSKLLMDATMHMIVDEHDCGTKHGVALPVMSPEVHDRYLAHEFNAGGLHIHAGEKLTPDIVGKMRAVDKNANIVVRSPLKCENHNGGLCQRCAGLSSSGRDHDLGTNVGVMATQALGERSVQLSMKAFHGGGVIEKGGDKLVNAFERVYHLFHLPEILPNSATIAKTSGKIEKIEKDPTGARIHINGVVHHIGKDEQGELLHHNPSNFSGWTPPEVGMHVEAGESLTDPTRTVINPRDLLGVTKNLSKVQNHMTNELYKLYKDEGIKRVPIETVVRAMTGLTRVVDPGQSDKVLRGDTLSNTSVMRMNKELRAQGKAPIEHTPVIKGIKTLPLELHDDWMAKLQHENLKKTMREGAAMGASSSVHGMYPVPGAAFGAEFGLTSEHSLHPGLGHLKNVPKHHY